MGKAMVISVGSMGVLGFHLLVVSVKVCKSTKESRSYLLDFLGILSVLRWSLVVDREPVARPVQKLLARQIDNLVQVLFRELVITGFVLFQSFPEFFQEGLELCALFRIRLPQSPGGTLIGGPRHRIAFRASRAEIGAGRVVGLLLWRLMFMVVIMTDMFFVSRSLVVRVV